MTAEISMALAQLAFLVGTSFLIVKIVKNRNSLKDFDKIGSFLTFIGMVLSTYSLYELKMYVSIWLSVPTILFWGFAVIFSIKKYK